MTPPRHVGIAGPIDLTLLGDLVTPRVDRAGYAFPLTAHLVRELLARGHRVAVFAEDEEASEVTSYEGDGLSIDVVPMRPRARDRALDLFRVERRALSAAMRRRGPDLVHAHWTYEFALAALATRLPTLVTVHDWAPSVLRHHRDPYRAFRLVMQVETLARARHLTAVSPYIASRVTRWTRKHVDVVPNGLRSGVVPARAWDGSRPVVLGALNVAFDPLKNVTTLLRAFATIPDATLRLAGPAYAADGEAARWAATNGLADRVTFEGPLAPDATAAFLDSLDVFVHPSLEESFGMVVLEAMGRGVPVVAGAKSGAVPWLLDGGNAGTLCDVHDPAALAGALRNVIDRPGAAIARAQAATLRVESQFTLDATATRYEQLYAEVVKR